MESDRYFNLQLTIQKLEEELALYRNGTTGQELLDLIKEKDKEVECLSTELNNVKKELATTKTNFTTLIKSSRKTLADNEALKRSIENMQQEKISTEEKCADLSISLSKLHEECTKKEDELKELHNNFDQSKRQNEDDAAMISKLQEQGVNHVKKLNAQYKDLKDNEVVIKQLEQKIQTLEIDTWKDKEKITQLQLEYRDQSNAYLKDKESHSDTIKAAHKQLVAKVKEVETLTKQVVDLEKRLAERDEAYKRAVVERDDSIRSLKLQVEHLEKSHEEFVINSKNTLESREEHWKDEARRLEKLNENDAARIRKYEAERANLSQSKREMDSLRARNKDLEDKIKRQEQYMKNRLLRDRGNLMNIPEASSKQPRPSNPNAPVAQSNQL